MWKATFLTVPVDSPKNETVMFFSAGGFLRLIFLWKSASVHPFRAGYFVEL